MFSIQDVRTEERHELHGQVPYCRKWMDSCGLKVNHINAVQIAYKDRKEVGLFWLCLTKRFFDSVRLWTSKRLQLDSSRITELCSEELYAYVGLEIATSINKFNELREYWASRCFVGNADFRRVMSRDKFQTIRASLRFYPAYDHSVAVADPLWHSRNQQEHFMGNASSVAVPVGVSSLDENTIRCKARTSARSYMKSKPVRFGIRFYTVVAWQLPYLHTLWDNGRGNRTGASPPVAYCSMFRGMRGPYERTVTGELVQKDSPSALWCLQIGYQTLMHPCQNQGRLVVMDNFYTRHVLAEQLKRLTDNEFRVIGTVRFNNIDAINRPAVKKLWRLSKTVSEGRGCYAMP